MIGVIVVKAGAGPEQAFKEGFFIGQGESCGLRLADPLVSTVHAVVVPDDGGWSIQDVGSMNGTYLNDFRLVGRCRLSRGDSVLVGRTRVVFVPTP